MVPQGKVTVLQDGETVAKGLAAAGGEFSTQLPPGNYIVYVAETASFHAMAAGVNIVKADTHCRVVLTPIEPPGHPDKPEDGTPAGPLKLLKVLVEGPQGQKIPRAEVALHFGQFLKEDSRGLVQNPQWVDANGITFHLPPGKYWVSVRFWDDASAPRSLARDYAPLCPK